jgi:hypothetical protein
MLGLLSTNEDKKEGMSCCELPGEARLLPADSFLGTHWRQMSGPGVSSRHHSQSKKSVAEIRFLSLQLCIFSLSVRHSHQEVKVMC